MKPINYQGKKVFITGHTGFKGAWLTLWLLKLGAKVKGYALEPSSKLNFFDSLSFHDQIESEIGNVCDIEQLERSIISFKPDIIFHLAAQPLVIESYKDPLSTFNTNVMGTLNLFEIIRKTDFVQACVNVTSDKCYRNKEQSVGYTEDDELGGLDPYSASKSISEILTSSYQHSFFKDSNTLIASVRAGNVIGGGDWSAYRLIPDCVKAINQQDVIEIRAPHSIRPWQHVLDPLHGYLLIGDKLLKRQKELVGAWNFAPNSESMVNVETVVSKLIHEWGAGQYKVVNSEQFHETERLILNADKAYQLLKWQPKFSFDVSIKKTVDWYKSFYENKNMNDVSLNQIDDFENLK